MRHSCGSNDKWHERLNLLLVNRILLRKIPNAKQDPFDECFTAEEMNSFIWVRPEVPVAVGFKEWTRMGAPTGSLLVAGADPRLS